MEERMLPDMKIDGISRAPGGRYRNVRVQGVVTVTGDIHAAAMNVDGHTKLQGSVDAGSYEGNGMMTIGGDWRVGDARVDGMLTVNGTAGGEELRLNGMLNVKGDCAFERFTCNGGFTIDGLLNADFVDVQLQAPCKARDIGGGTIAVSAKPRNVLARIWSRAFRKLSVELRAHAIEGDDIRLERTQADIVRGNRVVIGRDCRIGRVEYRSELIVHPKSTVAEEAKSDGGHRPA